MVVRFRKTRLWRAVGFMQPFLVKIQPSPSQAANSQKILLSFDENCYINGGGIEALIDIAAKGYKKRQKINACGLSNHFQKIFCMVGLANLIFVFPSEEAALNDFTKTNTEDLSVMKLKNCWEVMKCG